MMRKRAVTAMILAWSLLLSACGGPPAPAPSDAGPDRAAPPAASSAPAPEAPASSAPSSQAASSTPEQSQPESSLPPEAPAETSQGRSEAPSSSSGGSRAEASPPSQSSLPEEPASPEEPSQPEAPSDGGPDPAEAPQTAPAQDQGDPAGSRWMTINEAAALTFINKERLRLGLQPLTLDPDLTAAARLRAAEMFRGNYVSPLRPDGSSWETVLEGSLPTAYLLAAENRAWTDHAIGQDIPPFQWFQMWQQSESQSATMADPRYTHCGVAILAGPYFDGEQSYAVALFCGY